MTKVKFPSPKMWLDIPLCKATYEAYRKSVKKAGLEDPLPPFELRDKDRLESILGSVKLRSLLQRTDIIDVAVAYFVHIAKSQSLRNGNKRMSIVFTNVFLYLHGFELNIPYEVLKELALIIVKDSTTPIDTIKKQVSSVFKSKIRDNSLDA